MEVSAFLNTEESNLQLSEYERVVKSNVTVKEELLQH